MKRFHPAGLHPHRADDRGCDHRHPGGGRAAGVPGLHGPRQGLGNRSGGVVVPHRHQRGGAELERHRPAARLSAELPARSRGPSSSRRVVTRHRRHDHGHGDATNLSQRSRRNVLTLVPMISGVLLAIGTRRWQDDRRLALRPRRRRHDDRTEVPSVFVPRHVSVTTCAAIPLVRRGGTSRHHHSAASSTDAALLVSCGPSSACIALA